MAELRFIQPNRLRSEARDLRRRLLVLGLPVLGLMALMNLMLMWMGVIILVMLWKQGEKRMHGADGEDMALGIPKAYSGSLVGLSDDYTIFNQMLVPNGQSIREIDFIVVGPNGIFAIEVKHYRGEISGSESDRAWRQKKRSHAGALYEQDMRNPVAQIKSAIICLKQYLAAHGVNNWIQGIVVFTHPECSLAIGESRVPVLPLEELTPYIQRFRAPWPLQRQGTVVRMLKLLREANVTRQDRPFWRWLLGIQNNIRLEPVYPSHIKNFMRDFVTSEDRVQGTMNHDLKAAAKKQRTQQAAAYATITPAQAVVPRPTSARPKPRHRRFTVIQGGLRGVARTRKLETTVIVRRVETETTKEEDNGDGFF